MGSTGRQTPRFSLKCGVVGGNVRDACHVSEAGPGCRAALMQCGATRDPPRQAKRFTWLQRCIEHPSHVDITVTPYSE